MLTYARARGRPILNTYTYIHTGEKFPKYSYVSNNIPSTFSCVKIPIGFVSQALNSWSDEISNWFISTEHSSVSAVLSYNIESYSCEITTFTKHRIPELSLAALSYDYTSKYDQTEWSETRMHSVRSLSAARLGTSKCSLNQNSLYELPNASPRPYSAVLLRVQTYSYMRIGWLVVMKDRT